MTLPDAAAVPPEAGPETIVADCLADLAKNLAADAVLTRLRTVEARAAGSPLLRARFLRARAIASNRLGFPSEALGDLLEARNLVQPGQDHHELAEILRCLALVRSWRGEGQEAALALLLAVAAAGAEPAELAAILVEAGMLEMEIGRAQDAQLLFSRALELGQANLARRDYERAAVNLVRALVLMGRTQEARARLAAVMPTIDAHSLRLRMLLHIEAMRIAIAGSELEAGRQALARAAELVEPGADSFSRVELAHAEAELALAQNEPAKADTLLRGVIARYAGAADDLAPREIAARLLQAQAFDALGRADEADRTLAAALRRAVARGLVGYADLVRSRIAARGGAERAWFPDSSMMGEAGDPGTRFVRRRRLGAGGFGTVERAYDLELGVEVALKRIALEGVYDVRQRPRLLQSARTEVAAASRIDHPGVVRVHGMLVEANGDALVIEELVEGPTLRALMMTAAPLRPGQAIDVLARLAFALAAVHAAGIVHRDVKPENIILRNENSPVLVDFGIAVIGHEGRRAAAGGTRNYMAPEQRRGRRLDGRADLYALGVIAHEMLVAAMPPPASGWPGGACARRRRIRHALERAGLDRDPAELISRLLALRRWQRPGSAAQVGARLARAAASIAERK